MSTACILRSAFAGALLALLALPLFAFSEVTGITPGGAAYRIAVPDGWRPGGPLVLVQHEYQHELDTSPDLGSLLEIQLAAGYAVAASGYRQGGWALFTAIEDNAELLEAFAQTFGEPGPLYPVGVSMGGLVAVKFAEDPRFRERTRGALAMCPTLAGPEFWDEQFDLRLIYDAMCGSVAGGSFPEGAAPYPWAMNLTDVPSDIGPFDARNPRLTAALAPATTCLGLGLPPSQRTQQQSGRLHTLGTMVGINTLVSQDDLIVRLAYATFGLSNLIRAPDKMAGRNPFFNRAVGRTQDVDLDYGYVPAGATIRRVMQDDYLDRLDFDRSSAPDSSATARIVAIHTSRDEVAIPAHSRIFLTDFSDIEGNRRVLQVVEDAPTHCGFTQAERAAAWDTLVDPDPAASASMKCAAREAAGSSGPCRFGRALYTDRFRSRWEQLTPGADTATKVPMSGLWFNRAHDGEGLVVEELYNAPGVGPRYRYPRRTTVSWYTYAPPGDPDPGPRWFTGVGFQTSQGMHVPSLTMTRGARFGAAFNPAHVERMHWGSLSLTMDARHRMRLRYAGSPAWGSGTRELIPLALADHVPARFGSFTPDPALFDVKTATGTYFNRDHDGEGLQLTILPGANGTKRAHLVYFTYDTEGRQLWLTGSTDPVGSGRGEITFPMYVATGTVFGESFNPADVQRSLWGNVTISIESTPRDPRYEPRELQAVAMRWDAIDPRYGTGAYSLIRLTRVGP